MNIDLKNHPSADDIAKLNEELSTQTPRAILKFALQHFDNIAISFSGAEDVALIELAHRLTDSLQVFSLDTGRLHPETYEFIDTVRDHYKIAIDIMSPDAQALQALVKEKVCSAFTKMATRSAAAFER